MTERIAGIPIDRFRDPIQKVLETYEEKAGGDLSFDIVPASNLVLTPEKPNSARSATTANFKGNAVGTLYVIAFKPGDGTGDENTYQLQNLEVAEDYPRDARIVPRSKAGVHSESHLTVVTHTIEDAHAEPVIFGGSFDLLGLKGQKVVKIGTLGQIDDGVAFPKPMATYTTGYKDRVERFADPHSVFSLLPDRIQVCAFLAISEAINQKYEGILESLNPRLPF